MLTSILSPAILARKLFLLQNESGTVNQMFQAAKSGDTSVLLEAINSGDADINHHNQVNKPTYFFTEAVLKLNQHI